MNDFEIGTVRVGSPSLFLIAGPCVIESEAHARFMADSIQQITGDLHVPYIFKASYDKANRTSASGFRGPGLEEGVRILRQIAGSTGLPVITDVHQAADCERVAEAVDVLQIPAFLCRQTDLLLAAARTGRAVNIKKGQFVAPWDMSFAVEKVTGAGNPRVFLTERGFSFGYNNLVVDMRSLAIMRKIAPGGLRWDAFRADPVLCGRQFRRAAGIHSGASPSGGCRRRGRRLPRSTQRPCEC